MQETLQCLNHHISSDPSLIERQQARLQWQQEESYSAIENLLSFPAPHTINGLAHGWPDLSTPHFPVLQEEEDVVATTVSTSSLAVEKQTKSSKKRKADKPPMLVSGNALEKKVKGEAAGVTKAEPQQSNQTEISDDSSKDKPKAPQKPDYIHVRARRGQATDSHSLAERVRRERISERMKFLQGLVPGCNKITGKAGMLDEIINYVQSLQRQVEFLSMKLAAVNPRLDFNMENFYSKEMNLACNSGISTVGISSDLLDSSYLQCSLLQQADMAMIPSNLALSRTISPPMSAADTESCYNVHRPSSGWDSSMQNLYGPSIQFHQLQGSLLPSNLKMEM